MPGRRLLSASLQWTAVLLITSALLEISLRLFPGLIPPFLLVDFNPSAREKVAQALGLPTDRSVTFPPRDDGGPPRGLRIFRPHALVSWSVSDAGFVRKVKMDSSGFCNRTVPGGGAGPVDFVALGDSFTFCLGVRPGDAWPSRLASLIEKRGVNLGSPGIGLYEYLQILKLYGIPRSPRLVILDAYEGNDLRDAWSYFAYRQAVGSGGEAPARKFVKDRPLGRNSFAYNLVVVGGRHVSHALRGLLARIFGLPSGEEPLPDFHYRLRFAGGAEVKFNSGDADLDEIRSARELRSGALSLDCLSEGLKSFADLSKRHGFTPVIAYTPSAHTAYAGFVRFEDPEMAPLLSWFSSAQRKFYEDRCRELGIAFLDLTPALQAAARSLGEKELLYYPEVLHLTARGHEVVAETMARFLRDGPAADGRMPPENAGAHLRP